MEIIETEVDSANSQDFPFAQSQTEDTIKICQVCRFTSREKPVLKDHMQTHFQCETCRLYYLTEAELEHHQQNHRRVKCDQCSEEVRKDELLNHKMNHLRLKSFGKKVVKKKVVKPVTGYGLWQKDARKKIVDENPGMIYTEVSRELGKRWALVGIDQKNLLKKQAEVFNEALKQANNVGVVENNEEPLNILASNISEASTSLETPVEIETLQEESDPVLETLAPSTLEASTSIETPVEIESLQEVEEVLGSHSEPMVVEIETLDEVVGNDTNTAIDDVLFSTNENHLDADLLMNISISSIMMESEEPPVKRKKSMMEKSTNCPLCDFTSHTGEELASHVKRVHKFTQSTFKSCHVCRKIFLQENKLKEHMEAAHKEASPEVVLVKLRKLSWPAIVVKREGDVVEVKMIADNSTKVVPISDIEVFHVDNIANTKNSRLKNAYARAVEMMKQ